MYVHLRWGDTLIWLYAHKMNVRLTVLTQVQQDLMSTEPAKTWHHDVAWVHTDSPVTTQTHTSILLITSTSPDMVKHFRWQNKAVLYDCAAHLCVALSFNDVFLRYSEAIMYSPLRELHGWWRTGVWTRSHVQPLSPVNWAGSDGTVSSLKIHH